MVGSFYMINKFVLHNHVQFTFITFTVEVWDEL